MATTKTNEQTLIELIESLRQEVADLKASNTRPTSGKAVKPQRASFTVSTAKTPSLTETVKRLGAPASGLCSGIVYPKTKHYLAGDDLIIHRCGQSAGDSGVCKYHTGDPATRHSNWQKTHAVSFPAWKLLTDKTAK